MKNKLEMVYAPAIALIATMAWGQPVSAQVPQPKNLESFVQYMQSHHRAPFDRDSAFLPKEAAMKLQSNAEARQAQASKALISGSNVKVNQDRNPWPKAEIGAA